MLHEIEPKKLSVVYVPGMPADGENVLFIRAGEVLLKSQSPLEFPTRAELEKADFLPEKTEETDGYTYLFRIDEKRYFTYRYDERTAAPPEAMKDRAEKMGWQFLPTRFLRNAEPQEEAFSGLLAGQLYGWYARTRFCGR